jgi:hypothetical protein
MPMTVRDDLAGVKSAAETFVSKTILGLRKAGNGHCGRLWVSAETARVRAGTNAAFDAGGDQAEIRELRENPESLPAEFQDLTNLVAAIPARHEFDHKEPTRVLRQVAARADERARERVDEAASHLVSAASNRADLKRAWDRTDEAVADLLFALSKQATSDWERFRTQRAAANRLRLARQLLQAERERRAIKEFRKNRRWWRLALRREWSAQPS